MRIKKLSIDDPRWDKFCLKSNDCWFFHTTDFMKYALEYGGKDSELLAFYIEDGNGDISLICPLMRYKNRLAYSVNINPNPALRNGLSVTLSKKLFKQVFQEIDSIALKYGLKECLMGLPPLAKSNMSLYRYNYLMNYGFENISLNTQIVDLDKNYGNLWKDIKKSHRYEINKGKSIFKFQIISPYSKDLESFNKFRNIHFLAAGRMTRSEKTWELQRGWIEKGNAIIMLAFMDNILVGGIFVTLYKNGAYYGVSANHPDYEHYSITHSIQWEMIKWLKNNRYKYYELGLQQFSDQPYDHPTQKEINISLFKRHFGGYTKTFYRGLKKYQYN